GSEMATKQSPRTPTQPRDLNAPFFNLREVAWLWDCSVDTVRRAIKAGLLPCSQRVPGGLIIVSREDLDAYHPAPLPGPTRGRRRRPSRTTAAACPGPPAAGAAVRPPPTPRDRPRDPPTPSVNRRADQCHQPRRQSARSSACVSSVTNWPPQQSGC